MTTDVSRRLATTFLSDHPAEAAALLEARPVEHLVALLKDVEPDRAARVLQGMEPAAAAVGLAELASQRAAEVVEALPLSTAAGLLRRLEDEDLRAAILSALPAATARPLRRLLEQTPDTAGALMDPRVIALPKDLRVEEALEHVRLRPQFALYYVYVIDREQRLVGVANVRELFLARPEQTLSQVMHSPVARVRADASRKAVLEHPSWALYHALPVVDGNETFLGVIRYKTLRSLEAASKPRRTAADPLEAALSLGELLWIVSAGIVTGFAGGTEGGGAPEERRG